MGKRKKSSGPKPGGKKREALPTTFQCLFCNVDNSVTVKIDKKGGIGKLSCSACGQTFTALSNYLTAPVDIYSEWVDACEQVASKGAEETLRPDMAQRKRNSGNMASASHGGDAREMADFILEDEMEGLDSEGEGGYED
ncbi:Elf1-domain-containing protein [Trichodelitschia bisporula]|uniref:Transcription elongation factor 1 homolog n=1 Tax=Trichodelitschia bisporula TaxID=703511 RepID=A0A6G1I8N8_9PEZI|nr:Elf1-domain-containing protein [Trichodelitschia bisporula]